MRAFLSSLLLTFVVACNDRAVDSAVSSRGPAQQNWWQWHSEKGDVEMAMDEAVNQPGGGDWATAVKILKQSNWPVAVKNHQIGMMVIQSYGHPGARRPPETLQQGLELVETAATQPGETRGYTPQHLRMLFERGAGLAPNNIPIDPLIAECWHRLENAGAGDPARCIELRRERLPRVGVS